MPKYHVNPATGDVNPCKAAYECRFGAGMPHFEDKRDAEAFFAEIINDSTVLLREKEPGRLRPIREGYLQGKIYPADLRPGDVIQRKVTVGNTTFYEYHEVTNVRKDAGISVTEAKISEGPNWARINKPERVVSFPADASKPNQMVFVLRKKPEGWTR